MDSRKEVQHVYLVGAKSLGAYGGYETFVYKLTEYHQNKENIKYHVACKANGDGCMDENKFEGVTKLNDHEFELHNAHCFKINIPQIGPAQAIYYDHRIRKSFYKQIDRYMADIPVRVELASEFRYRKMPVNQKALVIVVSQSGETADTLAALRLAKEKGIATMAIVNVVGSSIAREADKVFYTLAGPEISVATTKAYSAQLVAMYCLAVQFAKVRGKITDEQYGYYISELQTIPEKLQKVLEDKERIQWFAAKYANAHDVFFVGRGIDYAVCLEGSLKLKEISYIHSEAYAAGELKHGTISLIEQGTLVIGVLTQSGLYEKTVSNMLECKSRGSYLMGLTTYGKYEIEDQVNFTVYVPKVDEHFVGSLAVIPLQLLGYYVSVAKGLDVDKPRNLAKSVTVE